MPMRFCRILIAIFFVLMFGANVYAAKQEQMQNPQNQADCERLGGKWGKIGIFPKKICNLPTKDANKVCNDFSECEGTCMAELSKDQIEKTWRSRVTINASGKCTPWRLTVGCYPRVHDGKVKGLFCQD